MLAYAANSRPAGRAGSPRTLLLIVAGHAAIIGVALTVKMQMDAADPRVPTTIYDIPIDPPPPPPPPDPRPRADPQPSPMSRLDRTIPLVDIPVRADIPVEQGPPIVPWAQPGAGTGEPVMPDVPPRAEPVRTAAVFRTPDNALRPPYPNSKLRLEEEATLRLRLSIDARGRVTSVEPVGAADAEFLAAARRHIIRAWRYKPATEDGVAVATTTVITLSFRLDDA